MAIGKVNAYATVQAPNVDFGDIALNAQKFQEADIEKQKEMKVAQMKAEKPEEFKANYIKSEESSGVASYESSQLDVLNKANDDINIIEREANKVGGYKFLSPELQVKYNNLQGLGKQIDSNKKTMVARFSKFQESIPTFSKAMDGNLNFVAALMNEKAIHEISPDGTVRYRPFLLEDDGVTKKLGADGKPLFATYTDRFGNVKETATKEEIESGSILNIPKAFDQLAFSKKVGDFVKPYKKGTDTGTVKQVWETLTTENKNTIKSMIETEVINQRDNLIDVLYKLDPVKYKEPKKEYLEEDKEFARKGMEKSISGGIQLSNVKDVDAAEIARKKAEDLKKYRLSQLPNDIEKYISPDVIKKGFVTITDASPATNSGYDVFPLGSNKSVNLPAGSTLTGATKGVGGIAIIRVAVPLNKTELYKVAKESGWKGYDATKTDDENEAELASYTKGKTTEENYYSAPELTVNGMLQGNSSIRDYEHIKNIVSDKKWKAPKKTASKKAGKYSKYNSKK